MKFIDTLPKKPTGERVHQLNNIGHEGVHLDSEGSLSLLERLMLDKEITAEQLCEPDNESSDESSGQFQTRNI